MCHAGHQSLRLDFLLAYLRYSGQLLSRPQNYNLGDRHLRVPLVDQHLLRYSFPMQSDLRQLGNQPFTITRLPQQHQRPVSDCCFHQFRQ